MTDLIIRPNGDDTAGWIPSTGIDNYAMVDESSADDNSTYVYGESGSDLYDLENHTSESGVISNVRITYRGQNYNAIFCTAYAKIEIDSSQYIEPTGNSLPLGSYGTFYYDWAQNPKTSSAWTWANIDDLIAGFSCNGLFGESRITQVFVTVTYIAGLTADDSIPAFLAGVDTDSDSQPAYLEGTNAYIRDLEVQVVDDADDDVIDDSSVLVVVDRRFWCHKVSAYLEGVAAGTPVDSSVPAFLEGGGNPVEDSTSAYLIGSDTDLDSQAAFLRGSSDATPDSTPAYLAGGVEVSSSVSAFLIGPATVTDSQSAFLSGNILVTSSQPAYILGLEPTEVSSRISAYLEADGVWPFSDDFTGADDAEWNDLKWITGKST
jgi:hypothetical protein